MDDQSIWQQGCLVIRASGPGLDMRFCRSVLAAVAGQTTADAPMILDCSTIDCVEGGGVTAALALLRMCGRQFIFAAANAAVRNKIEHTASGGRIRLFPSVEAALSDVTPLLRLQREVGDSTRVEAVSGRPSSSTRTSRPVLSP